MLEIKQPLPDGVPERVLQLHVDVASMPGSAPQKARRNRPSRAEDCPNERALHPSLPEPEPLELRRSAFGPRIVARRPARPIRCRRR